MDDLAGWLGAIIIGILFLAIPLSLLWLLASDPGHVEIDGVCYGRYGVWLTKDEIKKRRKLAMDAITKARGRRPRYADPEDEPDA